MGDVLDLTGDMTISLWEKWSGSGEDCIISKGSEVGGNPGYAIYTTSTTGIQFELQNTDGTRKYANVTRTAGVWAHIVLTYNSATSTMTPYLNGVAGTPTTSVSGTFTNADSLTIGGHSTYSYFYQGSIDDARIYNRALSASEITAMYNAGKVGTWTGRGADNNWSTAANWAQNTVPTSTTDVVFNNTSSKNCTIDTASVTVKSFSMNTGYDGTIS